MRKELLAALLTSVYWIIAGFFVAYSAWDRGYIIGGANNFPGYQSTLPDPYALGIVLAAAGLVFSFIVVRTLLPSRATQRRRLMRLLDDIGAEDIDAIQHKLAARSAEDDFGDLERAASLRSLLQEEKRKNRAN